jgi:UDP-N-acetylglucosamine--N-acetylmuramyl-(pentapeptide) pyrophosphoryl-undecaprenol N-acetylglucosamine transferase
MRVIVTAGGTGGHIMPAIAIAEAIRERSRARILFIGTDRGMEARLAQAHGLDFLALKATGLKGKRLRHLPRTLITNLATFFAALKVARSFHPDWVIGTGGYVTGMVVLAGRLAGAKCAIQEQNSIPGLANRILGRFAQRVFLSFPDTGQAFPAAKSLLTGNPLRKELAGLQKSNGASLVIMGGSLGAHSINVAAVGALSQCRDKLTGFELIHQTGASDLAWVEKAYREKDLKVRTAAFFDDMAAVLQNATLVVCRAGGISLSELSRLGIPAIMIPYPHAADNHQMENARHVSSGGGGWIIPEAELDPERLASEITSRLTDLSGLQSAAQAMQTLNLGKGAERIAQEIEACSGV